MEVKDYLLNTLSHFIFTVLWWYFGYIGKHPLHGDPIPVSPSTSKDNSQYKYDKIGYLLHLLLYVFVSVH